MDAATLGMWTFLITEVLFFGGMFAGYAVYRDHVLRRIRKHQQVHERGAWRNQHRRSDLQQLDDGAGRARRTVSRRKDLDSCF